jgi:hypothetical protein
VHDHGAEDTITDSRSGLEWQQTIDANSYDWATANTHCANLIYATQTDWRLPTKAELESILDFSKNPPVDTTLFPTSATYWSSSSYINSSSVAWDVSISSGQSGFDSVTTNTYRARCVRSDRPATASAGAGGAPPGRYTVTNGTVYDTLTQLTWQQTVPSAILTCGSDDYCTQGEATTYCAGLSLGGSTAWRLPTISELLTLVDLTHFSPSIDPTAFPSAPADQFWSSSTRNGGGLEVSFAAGDSALFDPASTFRVRCVR